MNSHDKGQLRAELLALRKQLRGQQRLAQHALRKSQEKMKRIMEIRKELGE
jgi:hypothetical protein